MKHLTNEEFIETLEALAEFYRHNPTAPIPGDFNYGWMRCYFFEDGAKEFLRTLGSFTKEYEDTYFIAKVPVGHITLDFVTRREKVCVRKVVGTRSVPEQVIPSHYTEEQIVPAHEEEIVEWDCGAVMAPGTPAVEPEAVAVPEDEIPF